MLTSTPNSWVIFITKAWSLLLRTISIFITLIFNNVDVFNLIDYWTKIPVHNYWYQWHRQRSHDAEEDETGDTLLQFCRIRKCWRVLGTRTGQPRGIVCTCVYCLTLPLCGGLCQGCPLTVRFTVCPWRWDETSISSLKMKMMTDPSVQFLTRWLIALNKLTYSVLIDNRNSHLMRCLWASESVKYIFGLLKPRWNVKKKHFQCDTYCVL